MTTASWHTPPPEEVSEAQVSAAVARLAEADACGGVVTTMSLAALTQAEEQLAEGLEQQAGRFIWSCVTQAGPRAAGRAVHMVMCHPGRASSSRQGGSYGHVSPRQGLEQQAGRFIWSCVTQAGPRAAGRAVHMVMCHPGRASSSRRRMHTCMHADMRTCAHTRTRPCAG